MSTPSDGNIVMRPRDWSLLMVLSILWGGSFFFVEVALVELPPLTIVLGRVGIAAVALLFLVWGLNHRMPRDLRAWGAFAIMGTLNNLIPFCLIVWGQTHIASGLAAILNATTPLFTVVLGHLLTRDEKMTPMRLVGVLIGLAGVTVMFGAEVVSRLGLSLVAQFAVLGAAISYACAGLFGRRFKDTPPLVTAAGQLTATAVLMLPLVLFVDPSWTVPSPSVWAAIVALALPCTAAAYVIYFRILAAAGATNLLLVTFLIPLSAIVLGVTILGEQLEPEHLAGMALIGLGLAAIDGRLLKRPRRRFGRTTEA